MSIHRNRMLGLSLIELMIAMVLGLLIMAGVASIFSANSQINRSSQNVSRVQETARTVFELMGRDLRESGVNGCGRISNDSVHNVLTGAGTAALWWANWTGGIIGYEAGTVLAGIPIGAGVGGRVATSDVVHSMHGSPSVFQVVTHNTAAAPPVINLGGPDLNTMQNGDIAMVCDFLMASIFQVTNNRSGTGNGLAHATGGGFAPGNASVGLGGSGLTYAYPPNANVMRLESSTWYVGNNDRPDSGGLSLFRAVSRNGGGTSTAPVAEEVAEGITDLQVQYLLNGAYVTAAAVAANAWQNVTAVRIQLTLQGLEQERDAAGALTRVTRQFTQVIALRNRL
ncbi:MAG: PilW family protein [Rhodocyclaceae bacterium]|nr:PilW family protein [Rhodocyclaceae bacterium]MCP5232117.1 PilW family protein [Zoogloeaceae bacterium]MCB1912092.1 PilW family protein [Rhodocyclaceae bacterium]MCP5238487.1 PilW family protein [Zoogloeaceae bacterium]MCP5254599.1 PilW family protein [Zoogloeaceae bacterium]